MVRGATGMVMQPRMCHLPLRTAALMAVAALALAACGGDDDGGADFAGFAREPGPSVAAVALPDLGDDGAPFEFRAEPGGVLVVYFGYTNCPDVCPTTLSDLRFALNRMDPDDTDRVEFAMVTVDPDRDIPVLTDYVQSFVPGSHALGTTDASVLAEVAAPFGVSYSVETADDGSIEVAHSGYLYAVDDQGGLLLTWPFGVSTDDLADDLTKLLDQVV